MFLTCVGYGAESDTWITWRKDDTELTGDARLNINSSVVTEGGLSFVMSILEICSVEVNDTGVYSCMADNGVGSEISYFSLIVTAVGGIYTCNGCFPCCLWNVT